MHTEHSGPEVPKHSASANVGDLFRTSICSMDHRVEAEKAPWGVTYFGGLRLHDLDIFQDDGIGLRCSLRTPRHIVADGVRDFIVSIPLQARTFLLQSGMHSCCEPGSFRVLSTSRPYSGSVTGTGTRAPFSQLLVRMPGGLLRQEIPGIEDISHLPLKIRPGAGKIMKSLVELGLAEGPALSADEARRFSKMLVQAVAGAVLAAPELEQQRMVLQQSPQARILDTAREFIAANLSNPLLDTALVAAHCQISERYLQMAFAAAGTRVKAYIRDQRLLQCRADLQNPALRHRPIAEIAIGWGFQDAAALSRAYKAEYGQLPREERRH